MATQKAPPAPAVKKESEDVSRARRLAMLALKNGDIGCLACGWSFRRKQGAVVLLEKEGHFDGGTHYCDKADKQRWEYKTRPPELADETRDMLAIRRSRDGSAFDLLFIPVIGRAEVLCKGEALEFAHQKMIDVMSDRLPYAPIPE